MSWRLLGASVRGAAHARQGLPNQDAIAWKADPPALAIADGHGSRACCRSATGAALAVEIAVEALQAVAREHPGVLPEATTFDELPEALAERWRAAVAADAEREPLTDAEAETCGGDLLRAYGTTLAAVVIGEGWLAAVQIGDGDIVLVADGEARRPVPPDSRLLGNETTSLALPEAELDFRLSAFTLEPDLVLLATDGYANSFRTDEGFLQAAPDLLAALREDGDRAVAEALPGWLAESSEEGSGDDVTMGLMWRAQ